MRGGARTGAALAVLAVGVVAACSSIGAGGGRKADAMQTILDAKPALRRISRHAEHYRMEAVLGQIEPGADGKPTLVQHGFRTGAEYFYPASSVKLFAAVAALERLHELREETGQPFTVDTPFVVHPLFSGEKLEDADPTNVETGKITVRQEIRKIFLVSDNHAFNLLYALVGQDRLNETAHRAGLRNVHIVHRLSEFHTAAENLRAPRIDFAGDGVRYTLPERTATPQPALPAMSGLLVGKAYLSDDGEVGHPMDFAGKNYVPLVELQRALCMALRPDVACGGPGFRLDDADRALLREAMGQYPRQSTNPVYDAADYPDDYAKFILPGLLRVVPKSDLKVYDKVGDAYGFMTENAYVVDEKAGPSFFLAATLYANSNGVLNDDHYDYATVSQPFLADLGEAAARQIWK